MHTPIHTSRKLEKLVKKWITPFEDVTEPCALGAWNATVFYVDRKKCWLVTNTRTQYHVILPDIKVSDLGRIGQLFRNALHAQLQYDGFTISLDDVNGLTGDIRLHPTANDRSMTAYQNQRLLDLEHHKYEYPTLEQMPIPKLTHWLNKTPIMLKTQKRDNHYTDALTEMEVALAAITDDES